MLHLPGITNKSDINVCILKKKNTTTFKISILHYEN
jgi:hypothetical protein